MYSHAIFVIVVDADTCQMSSSVSRDKIQSPGCRCWILI